MNREDDRLRRIWFIATAAVAAVFVIIAITGFRDGNRRDDDLEVVVVLKATSPQMEFWQVVRQGIEAAAREYAVSASVVGPWLEHQIDDQIRILRTVIAEEPDGIVLAAADFNRLAPVVEEALARDIAIVTVDSDVDGDRALSFVGTNNVEAGRRAGEVMRGLVGPDATVAVVSHVPEAATAIEREAGAMEALANRGGGLTIGPLYAFNDEQTARRIVIELLEEHGRIDGIVALNETSTVGVARTVEDLGLAGQIRIVGFDASTEEIALLERQVVDALVVQKPFNMGYLSLDVIARAIRGDTVEPRVDTGSEIVFRTNMYEESIQRLIFPLVR